ncbi:MAG: exonuclease SbcCD subunit D [Streptosporangiaceae bacterium]
MKFLHTADWHVGKTLKGRDRLDEQRAVLAEIAQVAEANQVDAVLVAGDVYESSAPSAQAQYLVVQTLLRLRQAGAEVIVIAGNHDHGPTFEAYRPLMGVAGITLAGAVRTPDRGGVIRFRARSDGADVQVAVLPFLTQRYAVRAAEIVAQTPSENVRAYDEMIRQVVASLTSEFSGSTVNVLMSHLTCVGGVFGGGERAAQSIFEYSVPATIFPVSAHYVALGHLHRRQSLPAHCPVHYSGSPIAVDFGEQDNTSVVCVVEARPSVPARVTDIPIVSGRRLRTVRGTLPELQAQAASFGDDYLRVWLREPTRAGLRDDTAALLPNALEVRIDPAFAAPSRTERPAEAHAARSPGQLFGDYCASVPVEDTRVAGLFGELYDEVTAAGNAG